MNHDIYNRHARALAEADVRRLFFCAKLVLVVTYCELVAIMVWVG